MPEPDQRVVLVRHGETEWSRDLRHTGRTDIPLTDAGRAAAGTLAPRLADERFALVLTSPLSRAADTCRLSLPGADPEAESDDDLMEWDYGDYEGRRSTEIRAERPGWLLWNDGVPHGETAEQVAARLDRVIERVRAADGDVALFAHGHILRALAARWLGQPVAFGAHLLLATAALSVLTHDRGTPAVALWNDNSHLHRRRE
jgi:probable phosphoglycerate mutase